jgi:hypothetical protein
VELVVDGCILHLGLADLGAPGCSLLMPFVSLFYFQIKYPDIGFHVSLVCYMIVYDNNSGTSPARKYYVVTVSGTLARLALHSRVKINGKKFFNRYLQAQ